MMAPAPTQAEEEAAATIYELRAAAQRAEADAREAQAVAAAESARANVEAAARVRAEVEAAEAKAEAAALRAEATADLERLRQAEADAQQARLSDIRKAKHEYKQVQVSPADFDSLRLALETTVGLHSEMTRLAVTPLDCVWTGPPNRRLLLMPNPGPYNFIGGAHWPPAPPSGFDPNRPYNIIDFARHQKLASLAALKSWRY